MAGVRDDEDYLDEEIEDTTPGDEGEDGDDGDASAGDAAGQDAEGGEGTEREAGEGEDVDPPARTRGQARFQRLANEVAELRRANDELRRGAPAAPAQPTGPQEETEDQFRARMALLPPHEQMLEAQSRSERRFTRMFQQQQIAQAVQLDKANYDAKALTNPRYKRYAGQVEVEHNRLLQAGTPAPRETILRYMLGDKLLANDAAGVKPQKRAAAQRVKAAQTKPVAGRSDVAGTRGRTDERTARAKRLDGLQI
jgi:hypothetical protein